MNNTAKVYIVGAGPGPADLLTVRAKNAIEQAQIILYDALISRDVARLFPKDAERIFVGKRAGDGIDVTERQNNIHQKLLYYARDGKVVVRVKSGDPMIFSRGAEETSFLKENQIPYELIPGISAFNAASTEFGIPLTDRRGSNSLHLFSGRDVQGNSLNATHLLNILVSKGTAVLYMGTKVLEEICKQLSPALVKAIHACVVIRAGHHDSDCIQGNLQEIKQINQQTPFKTPALIVLRMEDDTIA